MFVTAINQELPESYPQNAPNRNQAPLFSPFFSGKTEKNGPPEARRKRLRRNGSQLCAERKPENVNRNFRNPGAVPVGNAVAKSGRFMYNTEKDYVALRLLNRRDSYQKERQI